MLITLVDGNDKSMKVSLSHLHLCVMTFLVYALNDKRVLVTRNHLWHISWHAIEDVCDFKRGVCHEAVRL